ncbi:hypothetical protein JE957_002080 [Flavobacterium psychrophilum]|nr:hypothetical protein [Flavobacterium psychrophilum]
MNNETPFKVNFDLVNKVSNGLNFLLYFSASITTLLISNEYFKIEEYLNFYFANNLNILLSIIAVIYFVVMLILNHLFYKAENNRYTDFIDNSLGTKLLERNSTNYFTNHNIEFGIKKLGINCFESSYFSKRISSKMLPKLIFQTLLILILFLLSSFYLSKNNYATILQLALPISIIAELIKIIYYNNYVSEVFENFKKIFSCVDQKNIDNQILSNVLNYEKTLSYFCVNLNSKIHSEMNGELSKYWIEIKERYEIK